MVISSVQLNHQYDEWNYLCAEKRDRVNNMPGGSKIYLSRSSSASSSSSIFIQSFSSFHLIASFLLKAMMLSLRLTWCGKFFAMPEIVLIQGILGAKCRILNFQLIYTLNRIYHSYDTTVLFHHLQQEQQHKHINQLACYLRISEMFVTFAIALFQRS